MKTRFPIVVTHNGVVAKIHRSFQIQKGERYDDYMVVYGGIRDAIMDADKAAFFPPSHFRKALVSDNDFLQPQ